MGQQSSKQSETPDAPFQALSREATGPVDSASAKEASDEKMLRKKTEAASKRRPEQPAKKQPRERISMECSDERQPHRNNTLRARTIESSNPSGIKLPALIGKGAKGKGVSKKATLLSKKKAAVKQKWDEVVPIEILGSEDVKESENMVVSPKAQGERSKRSVKPDELVQAVQQQTVLGHHQRKEANVWNGADGGEQTTHDEHIPGGDGENKADDEVSMQVRDAAQQLPSKAHSATSRSVKTCKLLVSTALALISSL